MDVHAKRTVGLGAVAGAAALALLQACSGGAGTSTATNAAALAQSATAATADCAEQSANVTHPIEVGGMMTGMGFGLFSPRAIDGLRCDPAPVVTTVTVCDRTLPATVHFEWTSCAGPEHDGDGHWRPGPGPGDQGGMGGMGGMDGGSNTNTNGNDNTSTTPGAETSTGTIDIVNTYATPADCTAPIPVDRAVTFSVTKTRADGDVVAFSGTTSTSMELPATGRPRVTAAAVDTTRTVTDAAGTVTDSVHLTGSGTIAFSSDDPPTRTLNEQLLATYLDTTTAQVTLTDVVYPPMSVCPWPISGTVQTTATDGTLHTLVYGPTCGAATLDGTVIQLSERGGPHREHH